MRHLKFTRSVITACTAAICLSGCSTSSKMTPEHLASIGFSEGIPYWTAQQKLASEGYQCFVSGAKREHFDCTKEKGFFPSCILRVEFSADDQNAISHVRVADPACIGTP